MNRLVVDRGRRVQNGLRESKSLPVSCLRQAQQHCHRDVVLQISAFGVSLSLLFSQAQTVGSAEDARCCFSVDQNCYIIPGCWFIGVGLRGGGRILKVVPPSETSISLLPPSWNVNQAGTSCNFSLLSSLSWSSMLHCREVT